jgi:peptide/nickel transport system permease protein
MNNIFVYTSEKNRMFFENEQLFVHNITCSVKIKGKVSYSIIMIKKIFLFLSLFILFCFLLISLFPNFFSPHDPYQQNLSEQLQHPSIENLLGRDRLGRDILSRIIHGARYSLYISFFAVSISMVLGTIIGSVSAYYGGFIDDICMRITDILMGFPGIVLAILIMSILGPGINNLIIALTITGWVGFARLVRGQVFVVKELEYIVSAKVIGVSSLKIIFFHILPNISSTIIVKATFDLAIIIIAEASLSFLGLGIQPPFPSWGSMINEGRNYLMLSPHLILFPGLAVILVVMSINIIGDFLRDYFDPKQN